MQVMTIMGSPRANGNTSAALKHLERDLRGQGHSIDRVNAYEYEVKGCTGCNTCRLDPDKPACIQEDDMDDLQIRMLDADLLIIATPLYVWGFTSQIKAILERCYSFIKPSDNGAFSLIAGKRIALLVTCAGPYEDNADLLDRPFERIAKFTQTEIAGKLYITGLASAEDPDGKIKQQATEFAAELLANA